MNGQQPRLKKSKRYIAGIIITAFNSLGVLVAITDGQFDVMLFFASFVLCGVALILWGKELQKIRAGLMQPEKKFKIWQGLFIGAGALFILSFILIGINPENQKNTTVTATESITERISEQLTEKTTVKPTEKSTTKPTEKPTKKPIPKPTEKPTEKPTSKPTEKPTEKPTFQPTEKLTEKSSEFQYNNLQKLFLKIDFDTKQLDIEKLISEYHLQFTKQKYADSITYKIADKSEIALQHYAEEGDNVEVSFDKKNGILKNANYECHSKLMVALLYNYGSYWDFRFEDTNNKYSGYYFYTVGSSKDGISIEYDNGHITQTNYHRCDSLEKALKNILY